MRAWYGCVAFALLAAAACGGDGNDASPTPTTPSGDSTRIEIAAKDNQFSTDLVRVDGGDHVIIEFTNDDVAPHNISIYETAAAEVEIFVGDTFTGPGETVIYEFDAPQQHGTYFFRCDVHPTEMIGDFIVR